MIPLNQNLSPLKRSAIHVFNQEAREFYGLERLWQDGKPVDISGIVDEHD